MGGPDRPRLAEMRPPGEAELAVAAEHREARDHVVAGLELRHVRADRLDEARRLVPQDGRRRKRVVAVDEMQVGMADTARHRAHQHLAPEGLGDVDLLDGQRLLGTVEDRGFHVRLLSASGSRPAL